jgi:hypothetical protein
MMQEFKTNDNVTLQYIDTAVSGDQAAEAKPWLILVHLGLNPDIASGA